METSSLIGVLGPDGHTFQARYCHNDGYPTQLVPALATALHDHHDGNLARLAQDILRYDWSRIAVDEANAELADPSLRRPTLPVQVQPYAGVGYHYTDSAPTPCTGALTEQVEGRIGWLYLLSADHLRVFRVADHRWEAFGTFSVTDLKTIDRDDLAAREHALDA